MRAVIQAVDVGALEAEERLHLHVDLFQLRHRHLAPGDHRLVRDDNTEIARRVDLPDRVRHPRQKLKLIDLPQEPDILIDGPVAVEEDSLLGFLQVLRLHSAGKEIPADRVVALWRAHVFYIFRAVVAVHLPRSRQRLQKPAVQIHLVDLAVIARLPDPGNIDPDTRTCARRIARTRALRTASSRACRAASSRAASSRTAKRPFPRRRHIQHLRRDHVKPRIDPVPVKLRPRILLRKPALHAESIVREDQARIVGMTVRMGEQRDQPAVGLVELHHPVEIHVKDRVRVQEKEVLRQLAAQEKERPCIAQRRLLVEICNADPETASVAEMITDLVPHVGDREDQVRKALVTERADLPLQDRNAVDWDQRLRDVRKPLRDPGSPAACHDDCFHNRLLLSFLHCCRAHTKRKGLSPRQALEFTSGVPLQRSGRSGWTRSGSAGPA